MCQLEGTCPTTVLLAICEPFMSQATTVPFSFCHSRSPLRSPSVSNVPAPPKNMLPAKTAVAAGGPSTAVAASFVDALGVISADVLAADETGAAVLSEVGPESNAIEPSIELFDGRNPFSSSPTMLTNFRSPPGDRA